MGGGEDAPKAKQVMASAWRGGCPAKRPRDEGLLVRMIAKVPMRNV